MRKTLALVFAVVMMVTCMPLSLTAATVPVVTIESVTAEAGQEVDVNVNIENNPGIYGAILTFSFPSELTMTNVTVGTAFDNLDVSLPQSQKSPFTIFCDGLDAPASADGTIITFTFVVDENVAADTMLELTASYLDGDVVDADFNDLPLRIQAGGVTVGEGTLINYGDLNSDGKINIRDLGILQQHLNNWDVAIDRAAADTNGDGKVNVRDLGLLQQYLNGWDVSFPSNPPSAPLYTVVFKDYDGTVLKTEMVTSGRDATAPADPYRAGYMFAGWDKAFSKVTGNITVTAQYNKISDPSLIIESLTAAPGEMVTVDVSIANNPGLFGAIITYSFDSELALKAAQAGSAFGVLDVSFPPYGTPFTVFCDGVDVPAMDDGVIMTLTFAVPKDAMPGQTFTIYASHLEGDVVDSNFADVTLSIISGTITVK